MPVQLPFTAFLNHYFAGVANAVLAMLHVHPTYPQRPIDNIFAMEFLVFLILLAFFAIVRATLSVDKPGPAQHIAEMLHNLVSDQAESIVGHGYEQFVPYVTVVFIFILLCNVIGLVPGFVTPTAKPWVPLGLAAITFLYYQYQGIRANGFGYVKQFLGPIWWIAPLMLPIEIISHLAARSFAHRSSLRKHVCQRHGDPGLFLVDSNRGIGAFSRPAPRGFDHPGGGVHATHADLPVAGGIARALEFPAFALKRAAASTFQAGTASALSASAVSVRVPAR